MSKIRKTVAAACLAAVWASGATMAPAATPMLAADQVSITSPTSGVTNQTKMDVTVTFSTGTTVKGGGNITTVQLLMNGNVVASYDNPPQTKSGTHTFLSVDFSSAANTGSAATLVARAYHANVKAGQYAYSSAVILIVDTIAPTITNLLPAWGSTLNISQPTLSAMVNDTGGSGLDPASIVLRLDGNIAAATVTLISSNLASVSFVPSFSLLSGSHTFTVDAKDRAGNAALTASATFQLDLAPLIVTISSPATGLVGRNNVIPLAATLSDAGGPGINTQSVVTKLDGGTISATLTSSSPTSASLAYTPPAALPDGTHTYTIDAKDQAGIPAKTATSVFTIDQTPPVLTLSPADGQRVLGPTPTISISYSDAISGVDLRSLRVTLDGTDITWAMTSGPAQATLTAPSPLLDGPHTLQVQLADQAGNVAQVSSNFRSDSAISPVGAAGGAVGITNPSVPGFGAEILIPPGALSENVTFFIEAISSFPPLPQGFGSAGPVVDFGPTTVFALPVTISVPYDPLTLVPLNLSPLGLRLFLFDSSSHTWTLVPILSVDA
ncbi:MAG TPA: Ig-like domain-containing protein, partial [Planctomycetota bacterium]|nr:Ig-like domain-containing protein [Planctomycetota bacterium]